MGCQGTGKASGELKNGTKTIEDQAPKRGGSDRGGEDEEEDEEEAIAALRLLPHWGG
jgi:hypothetical protein